MSDTPQVLLAHHLKALRLPTFLREYDKLARQCAAEGVDHSRYLLRLAELEMIERERRSVERRIKEARFPAVKSLDSFDFTAIPSLNKTLVLELARSEYVGIPRDRDSVAERSGFELPVPIVRRENGRFFSDSRFSGRKFLRIPGCECCTAKVLGAVLYYRAARPSGSWRTGRPWLARRAASRLAPPEHPLTASELSETGSHGRSSSSR